MHRLTEGGALDGLPGAERIATGLRDLTAGVYSAEACLVACASLRLRDLGLSLPEPLSLPEEPELLLYQTLGQEHDDPYYRYNSWRQELDSFIAALQARRRLLSDLLDRLDEENGPVDEALVQQNVEILE